MPFIESPEFQYCLSNPSQASFRTIPVEMIQSASPDELGAALSRRTKHWYTFLHAAIPFMGLVTFEILIKKVKTVPDMLNAAVKEKDALGDTVLHWAVGLDSIQGKLQILLNSLDPAGLNAAVKEKNGLGDTALHWAARSSFRTLLALINSLDPAELKAALNEKNNYGDTVLYCAAVCQNPTNIDRLLENINKKTLQKSRGDIHSDLNKNVILTPDDRQVIKEQLERASKFSTTLSIDKKRYLLNLKEKATDSYWDNQGIDFWGKPTKMPTSISQLRKTLKNLPTTDGSAVNECFEEVKNILTKAVKSSNANRAKIVNNFYKTQYDELQLVLHDLRAPQSDKEPNNDDEDSAMSHQNSL